MGVGETTRGSENRPGAMVGGVVGAEGGWDGSCPMEVTGSSVELNESGGQWG